MRTLKKTLHIIKLNQTIVNKRKMSIKESITIEMLAQPIWRDDWLSSKEVYQNV